MTARRGGAQRRRIEWTAQAETDLEAIGDYIARDNPRAAERWVGKLVTAAERAASLPMAGRRVPEMDRDDVREIIVKHYRIVYWIQPEHIEIVTVFEGHRRLSTRDLPDD